MLKQVTMRSTRQRITKAIQVDLGVFTYVSAYSDLFKHNHEF